MLAYAPVLVFLVLAVGIALGLLFLSSSLGARRPTRIKQATYECGLPVFETARKRVSVKFYLVALLFLVFDIEIAFLFPWAVHYTQLGVAGLLEMGLFVGILLVAYIIAWRRGVFNWHSPS